MGSERDAEVEEFVDSLFRNGEGQEADRLVLVKDDSDPPTNVIASHQNPGGWCKAAIRDRVTALVDKKVAQQKEADAVKCDERVKSNRETQKLLPRRTAYSIRIIEGLECAAAIRSF